MIYVLVPALFRFSSMFMMAAAAPGEISIIGYLLIKGARTEHA